MPPQISSAELAVQTPRRVRAWTALHPGLHLRHLLCPGLSDSNPALRSALEELVRRSLWNSHFEVRSPVQLEYDVATVAPGARSGYAHA